MLDNRGVYILHGDRYYIGSTNNIERRLSEHSQGKTHTTKRIGLYKLVKWIPCHYKEQARSLERIIKKSGHYDKRVNKDIIL